MATDIKSVPGIPVAELVPCVECGHDRSWHFSSDFERVWTDEEWEIEKNGTWDKGLCQWDDTPGTSLVRQFPQLVNDEDPNNENKCLCKAFKHPNAPRRREAIEHARRL